MYMNQTGFLYSLAARFRAEGLRVIDIAFEVPPDRFEIFCRVMYERPGGGYRSIAMQLPHHIPIHYIKKTSDLLRRDLENLSREAN